MHEPWWISIIKALIIINLVMVTFAYLTWTERKVMGRMQLRYGPNRAGPFGLLQPIADLVKLIRKEAFEPSSAISIPYIAAPIVSMFTALAAFAVIPFGPGWTINGWRINGVVANVPIALLLIFALGSIGIYGFIVGGWASESKFSILGSMRTCAPSYGPTPSDAHTAQAREHGRDSTLRPHRCVGSATCRRRRCGRRGRHAQGLPQGGLLAHPLDVDLHRRHALHQFLLDDPGATVGRDGGAARHDRERDRGVPA